MNTSTLPVRNAGTGTLPKGFIVVLLVILAVIAAVSFAIWQEQNRTTTTPIDGPYRVRIDYQKSLTNLLAEGHYDEVATPLLDGMFELEKNGPPVMSITLVAPKEGMPLNAKAASDYLTEKGCHSIGLRAMLEFGQAYPAVQSQVAIMSPGATWSIPTTTHNAVVMLRGIGGKARVADVCGAGVLCFKRDLRFAAVCP